LNAYQPESLARARTVFSTQEYGAVDIPLSTLVVGGRVHLYKEVAGKNYFSMYLKGDRLVFQAGGFVGLIPVNERIAIDVRPRAPISNLDRLMQLAGYGPLTLERSDAYYEAREKLQPSMLDVFARALVRAIERLDSQGLYRRYLEIEQDTSFPKGRIAVSRTIQRHAARAVKHRVVARWFQQSVDNAPNRCLRYACWYLAQRYRSIARRAGWRRIVADLNRIDHLLSPVKLDRQREFLNDYLVRNPSHFPPNHTGYRDAIRLACAVIRNEGITFDGRRDEILMSSLLVNMDDVFERYIRVILQRHARHHNLRFDALDGNISGPSGARKTLLDWQPAGSPIQATPDVIISEGTIERSHPVTVEVKYKPIRGLPDRSDIDQVISYAVSYRSEAAVLVFPKADEGMPTWSVLGRVGSITLFVYAFDLRATNLIHEEDVFARSVYWLARGASRENP